MIGPGDLQPQRTVDGLGHFVAAAAILDRKHEHDAEDQDRHHHADQRDVDVQMIDVGGNRGSGFGPKWKLFTHSLKRTSDGRCAAPAAA